MHVGVVAKRDTPRAAELADRIRRRLDATVTVDELTGERLGTEGVPAAELADCDLVVSIGGDGTFLFTAREVAPTPIMGVNLGEVGFLNAVSPEDCVGSVREAVARIGSGADSLQELAQIRAEGGAESGGEGWTLPPAVNEVAVLGAQRGRNNGIDVEIRVDGERYSGGRADGTLISTPAGSTAYSLSEGGPIVHPGVDTLLVTEMCAEDGMPSLAVPIDAEISVAVSGADRAVVVADGRTRRSIDPPETVRLRRAADPVRVAGPPLEFFAALDKLE